MINEKNNSNLIGSIHGVNGIVNNKFKLLNNVSQEDLKVIRNTPGAALGSTRDKPDKSYF